MSEWISVDDELPPCDGHYEISNDKNLSLAQSVCFYDGHGFIYSGIYRPIEFWRPHTTMPKRYGKIKAQ